MKPGVKQRFGSAADAATRSGLSVRMIRRLIGRDELKAIRVGRRVLVDLVALDGYLLRCRAANPPADVPEVLDISAGGPTGPAGAGAADPESWEIIV